MCEHREKAAELQQQLEKERIEHLQAIEQLQLTFAERELAESEKRLNDKKEKWYVITAAMLPFAIGALGVVVAIVNYASTLNG